MADKKDREERKSEAALQGFGQGASFGFLDELQGLAAATGTTLPALLTALEGKNPFTDRDAFDDTVERLYGIPRDQFLTSRGYETARDTAREEQKSLREQHPVTYGVSELAGGISTPLPGAAAAKGAALGTKLGKGALVGAGVGAASGAGNSESNSFEGMLSDSAFGSLFGAGAGAGGAYVGDKLSKLIQPALNRNQPRLTGIEDPLLAELAGEQPGVLRSGDWLKGVPASEMEQRILQAGDRIAEELPVQRRVASTLDAPTSETRGALNKLISDQMKPKSGMSNPQTPDVLEGVTKGIPNMDPSVLKTLEEVNKLTHMPKGYSKMGPAVGQSQSSKEMFESAFRELPADERFTFSGQEKMREGLAKKAAGGDTQARALRMGLDEGMTNTRIDAAKESLGPTSQHVFLDPLQGKAVKSVQALYGGNPAKQAEILSKTSKIYNQYPNMLLNELQRNAGQNLSDIASLDAASRATKGMPRGTALQNEALLLGQSLGESLPQSMSREEDEFKRLLQNLGVLESESVK